MASTASRPPPLPSRSSQPATQQASPNDAMLAAFLSRSHAECPNPAALAHTTTSLRLLARMRAWKNVIMVADALRRSSTAAPKGVDNKSPLSPEALNDCHLYHFFALFKLGSPPYHGLQTELADFLNAKAGAAGAAGVDVDFDDATTGVLALQLLQVELRQYCDRGATEAARRAARQACMDELGRLQGRFWAIAQEGRSDGGGGGRDERRAARALLWWRRVTMSIVNVATKAGNWRAVLTMLQQLRVENEQPQAGKAPTAYDIEILSRIGKVFLQMGSAEEAARYFGLAEDLDARASSGEAAAGDAKSRPSSSSSSSSSSSNSGDSGSGSEKEQRQTAACARVLLNRGLLEFARSDYGAAIRTLEAAIEAERQKRQEQTFSFASDHPPPTPQETADDAAAAFAAGPGGAPTGNNNNGGGGSGGGGGGGGGGAAAGDDHSRTLFVGVDVESNVMVEAVNNYAISCMYTCELGRATAALESFILEDPTLNMSDAVVFNLCTMYELSCDNKTTLERKKVLQQTAQRFSIHDLTEASFRIV